MSCSDDRNCFLAFVLFFFVKLIYAHTTQKIFLTSKNLEGTFSGLNSVLRGRRVSNLNYYYTCFVEVMNRIQKLNQKSFRWRSVNYTSESKKSLIQLTSYGSDENTWLILELRGAFNKFPDFFVQAFKIVINSWKFSMLLLYIL